jgi:hypothetical protein
MSRTVSTFCAAVAVATIALTGCGKSDPPKAENQPADDPGKNPPALSIPGPGQTTPNPGTTPIPTPPTDPWVIGPADPRQVAVEAFIRDLRIAANPGPVTPPVLDRVSPAFLKLIGKPILTPGAKSAGYSTDEAADWLGTAGRALASVGLPTGHAVETVAVFTGTFTNDAVADGRILVRLVQVETAWKVDWFQLGSVKDTSPRQTATPEERAQDFAVQAFVDAITGAAALPREARVPLLAALLSDKLRQAAEPFGQDRDRGYDYNPARLAQKADDWGKGATACSIARTGTGQYRVEIKGEKPQAFVLKLVKGPAPGGWLVDDVRPE